MIYIIQINISEALPGEFQFFSLHSISMQWTAVLRKLNKTITIPYNKNQEESIQD